MNAVVLARYSEALEWITEIPEEFEVFIYNKGEKITSEQVLNRANHIIDRPNVGRESETYFHHMATHARRDHNFTVYSQGDPFTHSPDFIQLLQNWLDWDKVQALSWEWREDRNIPPRALLDDAGRRLNGALRVRPQVFSLTTWAPVDFTDQGAVNMAHVYRIVQGDLPEGTNVAAHVLRLCKLDHIAEKAERHTLGTFSYGAIFAVRNDVAAALPRDALAMLTAFSKAEVMAYGYILERLWLHLFGADFILPKRSELAA